jgi:hypothetical protein
VASEVLSSFGGGGASTLVPPASGSFGVEYPQAAVMATDVTAANQLINVIGSSSVRRVEKRALYRLVERANWHSTRLFTHPHSLGRGGGKMRRF